MKKLGILLLFLGLARIGMPQFVAMPLNYPNDGTAYMSWFISIVDANTVWVGTVRQGGSGYLPYSMAVKTTDGGNTWKFDSIPVPGTPWIQHLAAWDANICYYLFTDGGVGGGSVWKTMDGGTTWSKKTTTQFSGGWANIIHLFSADTALVMGDPNGGFFEIQLTFDGGNSWTRVPASNMPSALTGETGTSSEYCAIGNTIWFPTSKGRCFKSSDRGLHWTVSTVTTGYTLVCFSDTQNGFAYETGTSTVYFQTNDGGSTWTPHPTIPTFIYGHMSRVPGINGGYVLCAWENASDTSLSIFYTNDFFTTVTKIDSNVTNACSFIYFKNPSAGWLGGSYYYYHNIRKFFGVLTSVPEKRKEDGRIQIIPNPSSYETLIKIPSACMSAGMLLKITDMTGRTVFEKKFDTSSGWFKINSSDYKNGIYILEFISQNGAIKSQRWIVQH